MPRMRSSTKHKRKRLRVLAEAQDNRCFWCGCEMTFERRTRDRMHDNSATLDHVFPRGDPRRHEEAFRLYMVTAVAACYRCNNERGSTPFEEYIQKCRKALQARPQAAISSQPDG